MHYNTMLVSSLTTMTTNATDPTNTRCSIAYLILFKPDTKIARTYLYMGDMGGKTPRLCGAEGLRMASKPWSFALLLTSTGRPWK